MRRVLAFEPLDCEGTVLGAGRVNAHTHVYSALAPYGMPEPVPPPKSFPEILERIWWKLDRAIDADSLRASARLSIAESLRYGTTSFIDHHESPHFIEGSLDVLADACEEMGIRAVLCYGATERNFGRDEAKRGLEECRRFLHENERPLVRGVVGLHASFTVSDETIREAGELCREMGTVLHVHVAEDEVDVADAKRRGYGGPLERLHGLQALPAGSILAHGVHLTREQVSLAKDSELWLVQNPRSNRANGVGYPPALQWSPLVALGTDGFPPDLVAERAVLLEESRAHREDVTLAAERAEAGRRLIAERFGMNVAASMEGDAADACAFENERARHVVVGGRLVVQDGRLLTADEDAIREEARREAGHVWKRMRSLS
jgi:cytosine/adenosine deaminase-related metal-dependent hydrolase